MEHDLPTLLRPSQSHINECACFTTNFTIGSCLLQQAEDGKLHSVVYESRKLSDTQIRYAVHKKELLAIKQALLGWHRYLDNGHCIMILTDHESLKYMNTIKYSALQGEEKNNYSAL